MKVLPFLVAALASGLASGSAAPLGAQSPTKAADTCGSQKMATLVLGDALDRIRAARRFADDRARRVALAELETLVVAELESEPDTIVRGAGWLQADHGVVGKMADQEVRRIEDMIRRYPSLDPKDIRAEQFTRNYRYHMADVVKLLDPRTPKRCAASRWRILHTAALKAEAL